MLKRFESFVTGINICYKSIQRIKSREMDKFGRDLKGTHVMMIFFLYMNPQGLTGAELSRLCNEDKAAVSRTAATLTQNGYITSGEKRYRHMLRLTDKGQAVAEKIGELITDWVSTAGEDLTPQEREIFYRALGKIAANLAENMNS